MMSALASELVAGFIGTLVLATIMRAASELGWTRMDLAFLLGTTVTVNRRKAKAIGYTLVFVLGMVFAVAYGVFFAAVDQRTWWLGAILGALHAVFVSTVLVNILLPVVHPRMGTPETAANEIALVEPPGFLMLNYGRNTFLITLVAHIAYGIVVSLTIRGI
jgi:hypothetical protein